MSGALALGVLMAGVLMAASACGGGGGPALAAASPAASAQPAVPASTSPAPAGYRLVWADEFDTPGPPDAARWDHDTGRNRQGWHNNELQYYSRERSENAVVADGRLKITARVESLRTASDWGGQRYTSARLLTRGKAQWTYGFFEVRAKLPCAKGSWPAIWMLGTGGRWPQDGEIDIMEHVGNRPGRVLATVHTAAGSGGNGNGNTTQVGDVCTVFHDFQMHWTADAISFGIDGVVFHRYANPRTGAAAWPFDAPQFLLLNIAVGGDLGGAVDDSSFPAVMEVEHVRVYQRPG